MAASVGSGVAAAAISFATGLLLLALLYLVNPRLRAGVARLRPAIRGHTLRPWQLLGGVGGAWLVTTQGLTVPVLGVTIFTVAVVAGQVSGSLGVDRLGLSPAGSMPVSGRRAAAAVLALGAVALSGLSQASTGGSAAAVAATLAVTAGLAVAVQQAINARVSAAAGDALSAAVVNFVVGTAALMTALAILFAFGAVAWGEFPGQLWLYLGGPIGVAFIALAAWAVRGIGVLAFGLLAIAGQLLGAVVLDLVAPAGAELGWGQFAGLLLVGLAVRLALAPARAGQVGQ